VSHDADLDELLGRLRAQGARITTARRSVLAELVRSGADHPTADQLARRIRRTHPELHVSTIYRTLDFVESSGLVVRAGFGEGATTYHLADDHHHHAVCDRCGTVIQLPSGTFRPVVTQLRREHGFEADPHHVSIGGLCAACVAKE
jgi:Fe2+ or Zn2+ uptake regulation protein